MKIKVKTNLGRGLGSGAKEYCLYTARVDVVHILSKDCSHTACGKITLAPNRINTYSIEEIKKSEFCYKCISNCNVHINKMEVIK